MYNNTKEFVTSTVTPAVQSACSKAQPAIQAAQNVVCPVYQGAKNAVEPAVSNARSIVEPLVQPAVDTAFAIKDYGTQKVGEILHLNGSNKDEGLF